MRRTADKRPITVTGAPGSSTNPATWSTYSEAAASTAGVGLGYALGDGIGCWDLDDCFERARLKPWAQEILDAVDPLFVEVSQSGTGIHIFVTTDAAHGRVKRFTDHRVEFYPTGRYIAVTGRTLKF